MACLICILDEVLQGESSGGYVTFLFYDADQDGDADPGGSPVFIDTNGCINTEGYVPGDYYFEYTVGEGECETTSDPFFIRVLPRVDAGIGQTIQPCESDAEINLFSLLMGTPDETGTWSGNGTQNAGYDEGDPDDPMDDTFDPGSSGEGVFTFVYTVQQVVPNGFTLSDCSNCDPLFTTITIQVLACSAPPDCDTGLPNMVQICSSAGCTFNMFDELGGTPATGGLWFALAGNPQVIVITGGHLGTVNFANATPGMYQFEYSLENVDPDCDETTILSVQVIAAPNAGNNFTLNLCESGGNTNLNPLLGAHSNGGTWSISPGLPNGSFTPQGFINPAVGDEGVYTVTYTVTVNVNGPCGSSCTDTATGTITIIENCNAGANTGSTLCDNGSFTLDPVTMFGGGTTPGGTFIVFGQAVNCNGVYDDAFFSVNGGPVQNYQGATLQDGDVLDEFQSIGCILFVYTCTTTPGQCNDQSTYNLQIIDCTPSCNSVLTIQATACVLTIASLTNCPNPVYQWQVLSGSSWIPAPGDNDNNNYTGIHGSTYRLRVTGCPNCPPIFSNQITVSCPPSSCTIVCDSFVYNVALQRLEAQWTMTGGSGNVQGWFNRANINNTPCSNCNGWAVNQCNFTGTNATTAICNVAQTGVEQCWRVVIQALGQPFCQVVCCVKIPAIAALKCYTTPPLTTEMDIIGLTVNAGAGNVNIINAAQFGCDEYDNLEPNGTCNGNVNCGLPQLVIDINQWLAANGHSGTAYMLQSTKSPAIKVKDTNVIFVNLLRSGGPAINFIQSDTCTAGDSATNHFQGVNSVANFPVMVGQQYAGAPGSLNLFDMLDLYIEEISHAGTFTNSLNTAGVPTGCANIAQNCFNGSPVTLVNNPGFGDHGDVSWVAFTAIGSPCTWQFQYVFSLGNGFNECIYISLIFTNTAP